jgi:hypothetical protein
MRGGSEEISWDVVDVGRQDRDGGPGGISRVLNYSHSHSRIPLPHPPVRARTDARTNPSAQRATQLRSVLARVYAVSRQNQINTTVL